MSDTKLPEPRYIGDGVYASFDGYHIIITTGHHSKENADNVIALENIVFANLKNYGKYVQEFYKNESNVLAENQDRTDIP